MGAERGWVGLRPDEKWPYPPNILPQKNSQQLAHLAAGGRAFSFLWEAWKMREASETHLKYRRVQAKCFVHNASGQQQQDCDYDY